jgi:hypothetical protein
MADLMTTVAEELNKVISSKEDIRLAINEKGVEVDADVPFMDFGDKVREIDTAGEPPVIAPLTVTTNGVYNAPSGVDAYDPVTVDVPSTPSGEWQPHPDWWDIEQIFKDDPDPNKRAIFLLTDSLNTFVINTSQIGNSSAYYKTSDGQTLSGSGTIIFDKSKDKPCSEGYKTRWIIVYSSIPDIYYNFMNGTINNPNRSLKYSYVGNFTYLRSYCFGSSTSGVAGTPLSMPCTLLEASKLDVSVTAGIGAVVNNAFYNCFSLKRLDLPNGITSFGGNSFTGCFSLLSINIPNGITSISSIFDGCRSLKSITIPNTVTTWNADLSGTTGFPALLFIDVPFGWVAPNMNLSMANLFPESSAIELFTRLGNGTSTLTFGSTILNRWSQSTKDIAINKGYILA